MDHLVFSLHLFGGLCKEQKAIWWVKQRRTKRRDQTPWNQKVFHSKIGWKISAMVELVMKLSLGLEVISANHGLVQCTFFVPRNLSDRNGNWHMGAMATLIDGIGYAAIAHSTAGLNQLSVNLDISYLSTVKIEEEVEIEAKVLSQMDKLSSVQVEIRRKGNGELIALGKQWMMNSVHPKKSSKL